MNGWLLPTLGYVVLVGATGITARLALRTITWEELVLWVPIAYIGFSLALALARDARLPLGIGGFWAAVTAVGAAAALILFFYALNRGDASEVVPVSSAYPLITLVGGAIVLAERITLARVVGALVIVAGVVVISR